MKEGDSMARMNKTTHGFNWETGDYTRRELSRSFDTLKAAQRFAEGKNVIDIYRSHGRFVVVWVKVIQEE